MRDSISSHHFVRRRRDEANGVGKDDEPYRDSYSWFDPEEGDYVGGPELINEFLPVRPGASSACQCAPIGLVENEKVDNFLTT
jgi:hypothetical protein